MLVFGPYRAARPLHQGSRTSVWSAQRGGDDAGDVLYEQLNAGEEFVVKAVRRATPAGTADSPDETIAALVERARVQKRLNIAGAKHWASLVDTGAYADGIYFVYPAYPATAATLIESKAPVGAADLLALIEGVRAGLAELRKASGRPHGNLKPSNVLLAHAGPIRRDAVLLTDPASDAVAASRGEGADVSAIGRLIYALVLHRPYAGTEMPDAPASANLVPPSPEWSRLGRAGEAWRSLCLRLLRPSAAGGRAMSLASLDEAVRRITPRRRLLRPRTLAAAVAIFGALGAAGAFQYVRYQHEWARLCVDYGDWFGPLREGFDASAAPGTPAAADRADMARDPHLRDDVLGTLDRAKAAGVEFDPRRLAHLDAAPVDLKDRPPLSLRAALDTRAAYAAVQKVADELTAARWDALRRVVHRQEECEGHGWPRLAALAAAAAKGVGRDARSSGGTGLWAAMANLERADQSLTRLDAARDAARQTLEAITAGMAPAHNVSSSLGGVVEPVQESLKESLKADAPDATAAAADRLAERVDLAAHAGENLRGALPLLIDLSRRQNVFVTRGWLGPAKALAQLVEQFSPVAEPAEARPPLQQARGLCDRIDAEWEAVQARRKVFEASGDSLLATYSNATSDALAGAVSREALAPLADKLAQLNADENWNAAARAVAAPSWKRLDPRLFATSPAHAAVAARGKPPATAARAGPEDVRGFLAESADERYWYDQYRTVAAAPTTVATATRPTTVATSPRVATMAAGSAEATPSPDLARASGPAAGGSAGAVLPSVEDPRADWKPEAQLAFLRDQDLSKLAAAGSVDNLGLPRRPAGDDDRELADFRARLAGVGAMVAKVRGAPLTRQTRPELEGQVRSVDGQIEGLRSEVNDALRQRRAALTEADKLKASLDRFIDECNGSKLDAAPEIADRWRESNALFAGRAAKVPRALEALASERATLRERLLKLDAAYRQTAPPATLPAGDPASRTLADALLAQLRSLRQSALRDALDVASKPGVTAPTFGQFDAALALMRARLAAAGAEATQIAADAAEARRLLDEGLGPDEGEAGRVPAQLLARHDGQQGGELARAPAVAAALAPLRTAVTLPADRPTLRAAASDETKPLGVRLSAWRRLADLPGRAYPADVAELKDDQSLIARYRAAAAQLPGTARQSQARRAIDDEARRQWEAFLSRTTGGDNLTTALAVRQDFAADDPSNPPRLDARTRFNLALRDLRRHLDRPALASLTGDEAASLVRGVQKAADDLPAASRGAADVAALLANLRQWSADAAPPDPAHLGPLSPGVAEARRLAVRPWAWSVDVSDDRNVLTYRRAAAGKSATELTFRKVDRPDAEGGPFFLGTTEVTLGAFNDVASAAGDWGRIKSAKMLRTYTPGNDDRKGPRVWVWTPPSAGGRDDENGIEQSVYWLSEAAVGKDFYDHYFAGDPARPGEPSLTTEFNHMLLHAPAAVGNDKAVNPSPRQPMQYVSPDAAVELAKLVGCRLPTPAEWKAAYKAEMPPPQLNGANLRDHAWRLQWEHNRNYRDGGGQGRVPPDAGMFRVESEKEAGAVYVATSTGKDYGEVDTDKPNPDGVLFFREAASGGRGVSGSGGADSFHHLAGNVGEFVQDDAGKIYVIGGSALSPPGRRLDQEYEVDATAKGFSDVGFRLLLAGPPKATERLAKLVGEGTWYLERR